MKSKCRPMFSPNDGIVLYRPGARSRRLKLIWKVPGMFDQPYWDLTPPVHCPQHLRCLLRTCYFAVRCRECVPHTVTAIALNSRSIDPSEWICHPVLHLRYTMQEISFQRSVPQHGLHRTTTGEVSFLSALPVRPVTLLRTIP